MQSLIFPIEPSDSKPNISDFLKANKSTRLHSRDIFMMMALWMKRYPHPQAKTLQAVRPTGCVLVDDRDRVISIQSTGESHAAVRAILMAPIDPSGSDIYLSRFPCPMCTKMMVQAGIQKVFYFPAKDWEVDWAEYCRLQELVIISNKGIRVPMVVFPPSPVRNSGTSLEQRIQQKCDSNIKSVHRLIAHNPIAMSVYIPVWNEFDYESVPEVEHIYWELDETVKTKHQFVMPTKNLVAAFNTTVAALELLRQRYSILPKSIVGEQELMKPEIFQHAIVLAHIAAKRTDDHKTGVGAVLVDESGCYISVGWNGFPKKGDILDYPQAGADDFVEDELKYEYILHAEQNALMWRTRPSPKLEDSIMVTTKLPCDECSPVMYDCGVRRVVSNSQAKKSSNDPARLRGLSYEKIEALMSNIWVFY